MRRVVKDDDYTGKETEIPISDLTDGYALGVEIVYSEESDGKCTMYKEKYCIGEGFDRCSLNCNKNFLTLVDEWYDVMFTEDSVLDMISAIGKPVYAWFDGFEERREWMKEAIK